MDAVVALQPNVALTDAVAVRCWWSTRPDRKFSTHLTVGSDDPSLHAETLSVLGNTSGATAADLVCDAASGGSAVAMAVAITAVQVNAHSVALASNT